MDEKNPLYKKPLPNVGSRLSDFKILKELGKGSYGTVYTVRSNIDDNVYVMKKMELNNLKEKQQKECYREVSILKKVSHQNIIKYYSSFLDGGVLYIIMEYAELGDLYSLIKHYKKHVKLFDEFDIWRIGYEILNGLEYLHKNNIIHRDIKCLNLFITKDKHVKIGDLGVSTIVSSINALHCTRVGTPLYLSPELVKQIPYDFKVDIWSCGCSLYHLACLDPPFLGDNLIVLGNNIVKGKPKPLPPQYSEELSKFIEKMLGKRPEKRPSAREALEMIPRDIMEKIKIAKENNVEIKTRPFSSVGGRVITYNKEEVTKEELKPIKEEKKIFEEKTTKTKETITKEDKKQEQGANSSNMKNSNEINLSGNNKNVNNLIPVLIDQKQKQKPKPLITSNEDNIQSSNIPSETNNNDKEISNSKGNLFRTKNQIVKSPTNNQSKPNILPISSTKQKNQNIKIFDKDTPRLRNNFGLVPQSSTSSNNFIEKVENFMINENEEIQKKDEKKPVSQEIQLKQNPIMNPRINSHHSSHKPKEELNENLKFPDLKNSKDDLIIHKNKDYFGYKRILSSKYPRTHTSSISNRPFTASNNRVLPPKIKSKTSRPVTAFGSHNQYVNRNNNVINININFYNIDMNKRFLDPNSNPLESYSNQYKNPDISLIKTIPQSNRQSFNSLFNLKQLKQNNNNNDFIFDKIIKTIEHSNKNKPLTINDFGKFK